MQRDVILGGDNRDTTVVAAATAAIVLAAIYWISRIGFSNPLNPIIASLGVSLFLISAPNQIERIARGSSWWKSQPAIALGCIALTVAAGDIAGRTGINVNIVFVVIGFALTLWTFIRFIRPIRLPSFALLIGVIVFTVWCAGVIWGSRYKMPLFWETLTLRGNIHHDTFYYADIANMLETYGVPTTGLDGIPIIRYHFGSPWVFAKWGHLTGSDVLSFYSLGYPVIVLPLFFSSILTFATELRNAFGKGDVPLRSDWRVWLVFLAATVGFIPTSALDALAVWNSNAFISESYLIGMPVFILMLATGLCTNGKPDWRFLVLFLPVMLAACGFLKISMMILGFALVVYLAVRLTLYRQPTVVAGLILSVIAVGLTYRVVSLPAQNGGFSPFHFMRYDALEGWQQFFPLIHLLWTWAYVWLRAREEGITDLSSLEDAVRSRRTIDVEVLLVIAILGFIPGEVVSIHGGSAVYFSDVQRWIALAFIIARMPLFVAGWGTRDLAASGKRQAAREGRVQAIRLSRVLTFFVALPFVITLFVNLAQWPTRVLRTNVALRHQLKTEPSVYKPIVTALRDISRLPVSERRQTLLFIPQSSTQYWSMFTGDGRCTFTPLIAPGLASVAMLDGMPAPNCQITEQYNMNLYHKRTQPQTVADVSDRSLCTRARGKGFSKLIVLDAPEGQTPRRRRIDCYLL
jgi:hypothetical protein